MYLRADNSGQARWLQLAFSIRLVIKVVRFAPSALLLSGLFSFLRALLVFGFGWLQPRRPQLLRQCHATLLGVLALAWRMRSLWAGSQYTLGLPRCLPSPLSTRLSRYGRLFSDYAKVGLRSLAALRLCAPTAGTPRSAIADYVNSCPTAFDPGALKSSKYSFSTNSGLLSIWYLYDLMFKRCCTLITVWL